MKSALLCLFVFALLYSTGCSAADHDFNSVVIGVEHQYSAHAQRVPLMGLVSLCARVTTHGGVKGMHIAEFDNIQKLDAVELSSLLQSRRGERWQPFVVDRKTKNGNSGGDESVIFVRPDGHFMYMFIADYNHGELDLVRMELNGAALAKWMNDRNSHGRSVSHNGQERRQTD